MVSMNFYKDSSARMQPRYSDMQMDFISRADQKRLITKLPRLQMFSRIYEKLAILGIVHSCLVFSSPICTIFSNRICFSLAITSRLYPQKLRSNFCFSRITGKA